MKRARTRSTRGLAVDRGRLAEPLELDRPNPASPSSPRSRRGRETAPCRSPRATGRSGSASSARSAPDRTSRPRAGRRARALAPPRRARAGGRRGGTTSHIRARSNQPSLNGSRSAGATLTVLTRSRASAAISGSGSTPQTPEPALRERLGGTGPCRSRCRARAAEQVALADEELEDLPPVVVRRPELVVDAATRPKSGLFVDELVRLGQRLDRVLGRLERRPPGRAPSAARPRSRAGGGRPRPRARTRSRPSAGSSGAPRPRSRRRPSATCTIRVIPAPPRRVGTASRLAASCRARRPSRAAARLAPRKRTSIVSKSFGTTVSGKIVRASRATSPPK